MGNTGSDVEAEIDDPWAVGPLGSTTASFVANRDTVVWEAFLAGVCLTVGSFLLVVAWRWLTIGGRLDGVACASVFGCYLLAFGVILTIVVLCDATLRVHLCKRGFYCDRLRHRRKFLWNRIREVREDSIHLYRNSADLRDRLEGGTIVGYRVVDLDGHSFRFGGRQETWTELLACTLRKAATAYGFSWTVREYHLISPQEIARRGFSYVAPGVCANRPTLLK
jgi:hypothetical protein